MAAKSKTERAAEEVQQEGEKAKNFVQEGAAQQLGIRGAGAQTNKWKIRLQLTKPVTWVPLIWGAPQSPPLQQHSPYSSFLAGTLMLGSPARMCVHAMALGAPA